MYFNNVKLQILSKKRMLRKNNKKKLEKYFRKKIMCFY